MTSHVTDLEPLFIDGAAGRVFGLYFPPVGTAKGALLYVPPFAEEMNRCRNLVAEQARALAQLGWGCLLIDPYGTGDSEGELVDADWALWRQDVQRAAEWLTRKTRLPVTLWGLRLGALLAADVAQQTPERFAALLLWQPVVDGKLFLTQVLRQRVAYLMDRGLPAETTDQMRQAMQQGENVEVAGYTLSQRLVESIDNARLSGFSALQGQHIDWFENVSEPGKPLTPASLKAIDQLNAANTVRVHPFSAPPIWQLHDRDYAPDLIAKTVALFGAAA